MKTKVPIKNVPTKDYWTRKLVVTGHTRILSVGPIIPPDWEFVRIKRLKFDEKQMVLLVQLLTKRASMDGIER